MRRASIDLRPAWVAACLAGCTLLAWSAGPVTDPPAAAPTPADQDQPFLLPTYSGESPSLHAPDKPPASGAAPDARELYERALACWPVRSLFRGEVTLEGRLRNERGLYLDDSSGLSSGSSRASAALVARIPLYSAIELDREREREWSRRVRVAESAGAFVSVLAERDKLRRQLDLLRALERRSQERVRAGVAETAEQVAFMEKVAASEGEIVRLSGALQKARIELLGNCHELQADALDAHIKQLLASHRSR